MGATPQWAVVVKVSCRNVLPNALTEWVLISPARPNLISKPFGSWVVIHPDTSGEGYLRAASQGAWLFHIFGCNKVHECQAHTHTHTHKKKEDEEDEEDGEDGG